MSSSSIQFHKIWIDQCQATKGIREWFGMKSALDYLIGEKLFHFVQAAEQHPEFAAELPAFVAEIERLFQPEESGLASGPCASLPEPAAAPAPALRKLWFVSARQLLHRVNIRGQCYSSSPVAGADGYQPADTFFFVHLSRLTAAT